MGTSAEDEQTTTATPEERAEMKAALDRFAPSAPKPRLTVDDAAALYGRTLFDNGSDHLALQRSKATTPWTKSSDGTHWYRYVVGLRVDSFGLAHLIGDAWKAGAAMADAMAMENFAQAAEALGAKPAASPPSAPPPSAPAPDPVPETERDPVDPSPPPTPPSIAGHLRMLWARPLTLVETVALCGIGLALFLWFLIAQTHGSSHGGATREAAMREAALELENATLRTENATLKTGNAFCEMHNNLRHINCGLDRMLGVEGADAGTVPR